jgi:hypothetical protein
MQHRTVIQLIGKRYQVDVAINAVRETKDLARRSQELIVADLEGATTSK